MVASGSSSDAQIFNRSKLKRRIENGSLGLPPPEPLGAGGPDLHYFLLEDDAFVLMTWLLVDHHGAEAKSSERHQMEADKPPTPADAILAPQADQGGQGPNENFRNPSREAKHQ